MPVQGNVYMFIVDGSNVAVSIGPEGALLVDLGLPRWRQAARH
jgi:hypothetical protein